MAYTLIFLLEKIWVAFRIFSKNTCDLDTVLTRTVNILTTNELVKLTIFSTTGPRFCFDQPLISDKTSNPDKTNDPDPSKVYVFKPMIRIKTDF